ncbi:MAG TPA: hypothetical protein VF006_06185 [Longimicrobium sp.]
MRKKIKVLFLAADPFRENAWRELGEEMRALRSAVQQGPARDRVELVAHFAIHARDAQDALLRHQPQIVHFAGPGDAPAALYLGDDQGRRRPVDREALRGLLGVVRDTVRIVVLDGPDSLPAVEALSEVADYTVGTDRRPGDGPAVVFAEAFYSGLAMGRTVLTAFELGVSQLEMEGNPDAGTPVRRIRPGVNLDATLLHPPDAGEEREGRSRWARPRTRAPARRIG